MKKNRVIAICCVLVLLVAVLSSCGKKYLIVKSNQGGEYAAYTDKDGSTVVDGDGMVAVYVTDSNDKIVTGEDGKEQTNYVTPADTKVDGQTFENSAFSLKLPSGWDVTDAGKFYKKGTEQKTYIEASVSGALEAGESFGVRMDTLIATNEQIIEKTKATYPDATMTVDRDTAIAQGILTTTIKYMIKDTSGKVIHYAENVNFVYKDTVYSINLVNDGGTGYDADFNYFATLQEMITFK